MHAIAERQVVAGNLMSTVASALPTFAFIGALATDVTYWQTSDIQWANFSAWLLAIGMVLGGLCLAVELVDLFRTSRWRRSSEWAGFALTVMALAVGLANNFIHARDGWTSVVPSGLVLSAITTALMVVSLSMFANSDRVRIGEPS